MQIRRPTGVKLSGPLRLTGIGVARTPDGKFFHPVIPPPEALIQAGRLIWLSNFR